MSAFTNKLRFCAGCKVNLYLKIVDRRPDGYHTIESLFYPLASPSDILTITELQPGEGFHLSCSVKELEDTHNILWKVYRSFGQETGCWPDIQIDLEKNIPLGSGLGGGSSDAAVLLKYLWNHFSNQDQIVRAQNGNTLISVAQKIGADVPFFLKNKPAWVTGIGETIEPVAQDLSDYSVFVICPDFSVATSSAYALWDQTHLQFGAKSSQGRDLTRELEMFKASFCATGKLFTNSFERVLFPRFPQLRKIKREVLRCGASACVLSGSGSSCLALVQTHKIQKRLQRLLSQAQIKYFLN
jgi:4-diphosphocytidyl-2-C-methyl-D-erythritol kinase